MLNKPRKKATPFDLPHAFQTADHMIVMDDGAVAAAGTPEEIFASDMIERIFRVKLGRTQTEKGWRYYCEG